MGRATDNGTRCGEIELTERQREVLRLIASGKTNAEIGEALGISLDGAKWHVSEILSRLGVESREEAAAWWRGREGSAARVVRAMRTALASGGWLRAGAAVVAMGGVATLAIVVIWLTNSGDSSPSRTAPDCPITVPDRPFVAGSPFPAEPPSLYGSVWYGTDDLWTMLHPAGEQWELPRTGKSLGQKTFWWSRKFGASGSEEQPRITVTGKRLDGPGAFVAGNPGTNAVADFGKAMLVGIEIPTAGCWEIRAEYKGSELVYVVRVVESPTLGSPGAAPPSAADAVPPDCPAQASRVVHPAFRPAIGDGPVYMTLGASSVAGVRTLSYHASGPRDGYPAGFGGQEVSFLVEPLAAGPFTLKSVTLSGSGTLEIASDYPVLLAPGPLAANASGFPVASVTTDAWRLYTVTVWLTLGSRGCYAIDVSGPGVSERLVFWADMQVTATPTPAPASATPTAPSCGLSAPPGQPGPIVEWMPFLHLRGRSYLAVGVGFAFGPQPPLSIDPAMRGSKAGVVLWNVTEPGTNPCYGMLDGSSAYLPAGSEVFAMKGYSPDFRLMAETPYGWRVFEVTGTNGAKTLGDVLDIRGRVASLTCTRFTQSGVATWLGTARDDAARRLTETLLALPSNLTGTTPHPAENDPPTLEVTFGLVDGTTTTRTLYIGGWEMASGFPLSAGDMSKAEAACTNP